MWRRPQDGIDHSFLFCSGNQRRMPPSSFTHLVAGGRCEGGSRWQVGRLLARMAAPPLPNR